MWPLVPGWTVRKSRGPHRIGRGIDLEFSSLWACGAASWNAPWVSMKCSKCGHDNLDGRLRCGECGFVLSGRGEWGDAVSAGGEGSAASAPPPSAAPPPPARSPAPPPTPKEPPAQAYEPSRKSQRFEWNTSELPSSDYQSVVGSVTGSMAGGSSLLESEEDAEGLGWLGEDDFDLQRSDEAEPSAQTEEGRRTVALDEIHKIAGLSEISAFKRIIEQDGKTTGAPKLPRAVRPGEVPSAQVPARNRPPGPPPGPPRRATWPARSKRQPATSSRAPRPRSRSKPRPRSGSGSRSRSRSRSGSRSRSR